MIFVPAWGWVGSHNTATLAFKKQLFSSPSGDGWFNFTDVSLGDTVKFSSPLGDGLVLTNNGYINRNIIFSSPSGDALVLAKK